MLTITFDMVVFLITSCVLLIGLLGSLLPVVPGCVIIWVGIISYKLLIPAAIPWSFVIITGGLTLAAQILDYLCTYWGAKKFGGSFRGGVGALIGALIGPFVLGPLGGIVVGPVIGAVLGEISAGKTLPASGKAGVGTIVGGLVSFLIKMSIAFFMVGWFFWQTLPVSID